VTTGVLDRREAAVILTVMWSFSVADWWHDEHTAVAAVTAVCPAGLLLPTPFTYRTDGGRKHRGGGGVRR